EQALGTLEEIVTTSAIDRRIGYVATIRELVRAVPSRGCELLQRAARAWQQWPGDETAYVQRQQELVVGEVEQACR
ncbi:MAG TPA: hypothetical protein VIV40_04115, partial [Kofleriaceae bacterium]